MNFHKIVFLIAFFGISAGGFFVNAQPAQAATVEELQALIAQLKAQILQLQQQLAATQGQPAAWCHDFTRNLRVGDGEDGTGTSKEIADDVGALIEALSKEGVLDYEQVVEPGTAGSSIKAKYFSEAVAAGVVEFQEKYKSEILTPFRLSRGTGFVGKGTRAKLNALYGCGIVQPPASAPIPIPTPTPTPTPQPVSPSVTVTAPSGGSGGFSTWRVGETHIITWQSRGLNYVSLSLETASDIGQIARTIANNVPASNGSYSWTISSEFGGNIGNVFVRSADSGSTVYGVGSASIRIESPKSSIAVLSPNGGETWIQGQTYIVTWKSSGIDKVDISLDDYRAGPSDVMRITGIPASSGSYSLTIPASNPLITPGNAYQIQIIAPKESISDWSDNYFSIVASTTLPSLSCTDTDGGKNYDVKGTTSNTKGDSLIDYSVSGYSSYNLVEGYCGPNGEVLNIGYLCPFGASNGACIAAPSVTVLSPNGGERWIVGNTYSINWNAQGVDKVLINVIDYTYSSELFRTVSSGIPASQGSYTWTIPLDIFSSGWQAGHQFKIFVAELKTDGTYGAQDESNTTFTIDPFLGVTSPNGGEMWTFGVPYTISWISIGLDNVVAYLRFPDGINCQIGGKVPAQPNTLTVALKENQQCLNDVRTIAAGKYKIALFGADEPLRYAADASDDYFTIVSSGLGLNTQEQLASIADAVSRLLQSFEEFKKSNP